MKTSALPSAPRLCTPLLVVALAAACAPAGDSDPATNGDTALPAPSPDTGAPPAAEPGAEPGADRPETRTDTIRLEGMPEPMELTLFRTPSGFPLPFSAYVPDDMEAESAGDDRVRFLAAFGGQRNPDAYVEVHAYPAGTDEQTATGGLRSFGASRDLSVDMGIEPLPEDETSRSMPWADRGFRFTYQDQGARFTGRMGLGQHDGRFFHIVTHYPAEYGDGFGPRAAKVMETWEWADGTPLTTAGR